MEIRVTPANSDKEENTRTQKYIDVAQRCKDVIITDFFIKILNKSHGIKKYLLITFYYGEQQLFHIIICH